MGIEQLDVPNGVDQDQDKYPNVGWNKDNDSQQPDDLDLLPNVVPAQTHVEHSNADGDLAHFGLGKSILNDKPACAEEEEEWDEESFEDSGQDDLAYLPEVEQGLNNVALRVTLLPHIDRYVKNRYQHHRDDKDHFLNQQAMLSKTDYIPKKVQYQGKYIESNSHDGHSP